MKIKDYKITNNNLYYTRKGNNIKYNIYNK